MSLFCLSQLFFNDLAGQIPLELALLSNSLRRIDLSGGPGRTISGSIPEDFSRLTLLREFL